jgi:hypothetical protein
MLLLHPPVPPPLRLLLLPLLLLLLLCCLLHCFFFEPFSHILVTCHNESRRHVQWTYQTFFIQVGRNTRKSQKYVRVHLVMCLLAKVTNKFGPPPSPSPPSPPLLSTTGTPGLHHAAMLCQATGIQWTTHQPLI